MILQIPGQRLLFLNPSRFVVNRALFKYRDFLINNKHNIYLKHEVKRSKKESEVKRSKKGLIFQINRS